MDKLLDKLILFILSMALYLQGAGDTYFVVPIIIALFISAATSYFDNPVFKLAGFGIYVAAGVLIPGLLFFVPLICYDILLTEWKQVSFLALVPIGICFIRMPGSTPVFILLFTALALLLKHRLVSLENIKNEYISIRDTAREFSIRLEGKNKELMDKQDYEVHMATLNERNRIAREIHDNIGHLLSSSILQIGALMATARDEAYRESLNTLRNTLSQGMNSIRSSIHDLHDESVDLEAETRTLVNNFHYCSVFLDYDIRENPDKKIKYAFLAILKECLSNIIKHSNADEARVTLREHPGLYQLIVKDNGHIREINLENGMGLNNIKDRVKNLKGNVNISNDKGFVVFITVPKEKENEDRNR